MLRMYGSSEAQMNSQPGEGDLEVDTMEVAPIRVRLRRRSLRWDNASIS